MLIMLTFDLANSYPGVAVDDEDASHLRPKLMLTRHQIREASQSQNQTDELEAA